MQGRNHLPIEKMSLVRATHLMGNLSLETTRLKNVQLQISICKLNEKLQRELEGRAGEEYTHHFTQIPDYQFPKIIICFVHLLGDPYVEIPFWPLQVLGHSIYNIVLTILNQFLQTFHGFGGESTVEGNLLEWFCPINILEFTKQFRITWRKQLPCWLVCHDPKPTE